MQRDLFGSEPGAPIPTQTGLFADVVLDRPLEQAYSYLVPLSLHDRIGVGKRVRVPFGRGDRPIIGYCVGVGTTPPARKAKPVLEVLDDEALLTDHLLRLTRWMADYYLCGWGQVLQAVIPAGVRDKSGTRSQTFFEAVPAAELNEPNPKLPAKQEAVLRYLRAVSSPVEIRKLRQETAAGTAPIKALIQKGLIRHLVRRVDRFAEGAVDAEPFPTLTLNADQERVWSTLQRVVRGGGFHSFLLYGVTGSGKTEIYLRAIEEVIKQGKEALVLVPEISLTPQTVARFRGRFGDVAVLHSHLGNAERGGHWRRVAAGSVQVVVGARSAVFAPTRRLGLIVIDEEHEHTFKQETTPRYHARDVAVMRARLEDVPILLGSATPSLESWHNAQRRAYTLLTLPNRVEARPLPPVELVDLRHQKPQRGRPAALSDALVHAMDCALKAGGQVMLLLNRRGFATHVHCPSCGHVESCRFCDLALTFHKQREVMLCHHCGYEAEPLQNCPQCGQSAVRYHGLGTEKLEVEIRERFRGYEIRRMDSDTMKSPGSHEAVLSAFRRGEVHILLGTQMIAKGLDFPNVTLVGVVNADLSLHLPDFRSAERTFQLLSQVAGRAGRGPNGGRVLVQTFTPDHPCIKLAADHDYPAFVTGELAHRKTHNYPPFQRLARVIVRAKSPQPGSEFAERMAQAFEDARQRLQSPGGDDVRLLGPAEAPVFRLKGYHRFHYQLQSPTPGLLHQLLRAVLPTLTPPTGVEFNLDVDPFNML
jgi:primosomal protein N' (replication factor Y) (superfamily II helicase)